MENKQIEKEIVNTLTQEQFENQQEVLEKIHEQPVVENVVEQLQSVTQDINRKESVIQNTNIKIDAIRDSFGLDTVSEIPMSVEIEKKAISRLNEERKEIESTINTNESKVFSLYESEFKNTLEISEYPKVLTEMYESGVVVLKDKNATDEEKEYAQKYLERLTKTPDDEKGNDLDIFTLEKEIASLKEKIFQFNQGSVLFEQRELLGIKEEKDEKPFDIKVLAPENWDTMAFTDKEKWWKETTGCPSLFVRRGFKNGQKITPTIFLSKDEALLLTTEVNDDPYQKQTSERIFQHEYRHTQRKFGVENDHLFRFIDESCTNVGSYKKQAITLDFIGLTTNDFSFKDVKNAYESGNDENMTVVLNKIKKSVGDKGILLIGGKSSSEHTGDHDGITELPLVEMEGNVDGSMNETRFMETLLSLRAEQDPVWLENFKNNITTESDKVSRGLLEASKTYFLWPVFKHAGGKDTPNINKLLEIVEAEIEHRKTLGEEGL